MANQALYGFYSLKDLLDQRVATIEIPVINAAIDATFQEHNRQLDALNSLFVQPTTEYSLRYKIQGARRLQPLDEKGRARPGKSAGFYDLAFPLQGAGDAWGVDYVTRQKMTLQEVNDEITALLVADKRWMRDHILAALYTNVTWTFPDDLKGNLTVQPLANADSVIYPIQQGADAGATETVFLAQAGAIADGANPYPNIYDKLTNHQENQGEVIALVPTNLLAATQALTLFREPVSLDSPLTPSITVSTLTGALNVAVPGILRGRVSKVWIVEWKALPNDYIIGITSEGPRPLGMRQDKETQLQGFNRVAERNDHPWYESQYLRRAGFGAWNRVGATVTRIGNASYAIPTNYTSPMA
jgi:hypothetical protein